MLARERLDHALGGLLPICKGLDDVVDVLGLRISCLT